MATTESTALRSFADARTARKPASVGIVGLGAIGRTALRHLIDQPQSVHVVGIATGRVERAKKFLSQQGMPIPVLSLEKLCDVVDIVVDCTPADVFLAVFLAAISRDKIVVTSSGVGIVENQEALAAIKESRGKLILATGALLGLDAVRAAALGEIFSARLVTRKPLMSLHLALQRLAIIIDPVSDQEAICLFKGTVREGVKKFPANANVAAALALAGIGSHLTEYELWADPQISRNIHRVTVDADSARLECVIENVPDAENPATSRIAALSLLSAVYRIVHPIVIGS